MKSGGKMQMTGKTTSSTELPDWLQDAYKSNLQLAQGAPDQLADYGPGFAAPTNPWLTQAQQTAAGMKAPDYMNIRGQLGELSGTAGSQVRSPYSVDFTNTYNPQAQQGMEFTGPQVSFEDTLAGYTPNMQAAQIAGHGFNAQDYSFKADQVSAERLGPADQVRAERVAAERAQAERIAAAQIGPAERVAAERIANPAANIRSFDIGAQQQIYAPWLQQYQMQRPEDVFARDVTTNAFTDEGVRQKYMDPYMQAVVADQQKNAQRMFEEQLAETQGSAAAAGAFGGTRQAVLESAMRRDLSNQKGSIAAQGLESAFQNAQQQFERDRGASMQAQQLNQQAQLQAALANQGMGFQTGQTNLQALLGQQELGANLGMRAQELNQNVGLQTALANQQAQLQAQGLGVNTNLQSMLANQQYGMQAALANQAMGMDVSKSNQQAMMQAMLANQQTGLQAALANQSTGLQAQGMNQQSALQAALSNQRANIDVARYNQEASLQAALANQGANLQAQLEGARMGQSDRQFLGGLNNQMNMAQAELTQGANQLNTQLGFDALKTRYGGNLQSGLANQQSALDAMRMQEQSRQWAANLGQQQTEFGSTLNLQTQQAREQAMNDIIRSNLAATGQAAGILGQEAGLESEQFNQNMRANEFLGQMGLSQAGMDMQARRDAYSHWMAQQQFPMQQALAMGSLLNPMANIFGTQTQSQFQQAPSFWQQFGGLLTAGAGIASNFLMPGSGALLGGAKAFGKGAMSGGLGPQYSLPF